ncbi:MAG: conserved membrane protein of unknown function [Promethearchaeota archaeon]|nr:MAG: conserved membrane protein of unknown function [Candidatus Lokiarchaeota archaeon]
MIYQNWVTDPLAFLLDNIEFMLLGITTLAFVIVTLLISGKMMHRGIKLQMKTISYVGFAYFGVASCWFGVTLNFITIILFNALPPWELHFFVHGGIVTIAQVFWIIAMSELLAFKDKTQKILKALTIGIGSAVEVTYIIIIFTNISWLGTPVAPIQVVYGPFSYGYLMIELMVFLIFGFLFVKESLKAEDPKIRLKGKFLASSFTVFTIASFLEVFFQEIWVFIIGRLIVMSSALLFYIGFLLPRKIEEFILK